HPVHGLAIELLVDGDVSHRRGWSGTVPMLFVRPDVRDITGADFIDWLAIALDESAPSGHDERLPQRMRVPCRASARLGGDARDDDPCRCRGAEEWVDAHRTGEPFGRPLGRGLRSCSLDFHRLYPRPRPNVNGHLAAANVYGSRKSTRLSSIRNISGTTQ